MKQVGKTGKFFYNQEILHGWLIVYHLSFKEENGNYKYIGSWANFEALYLYVDKQEEIEGGDE